MEQSPQPITEDSRENGNAGGLKGILIFVGFGLLILCAALFTPLGAFFDKDNITRIVANLGPWGPLAIVGVGVVSPLLFLPRWPVAFVAGLLYGVVQGTLLATVASTIGAVLHYVAARHLLAPASDSIRRRASRLAKEIDPDRAFATIFFLRAFPLSNFVVTNLLAGALKLKMRTYVLASFLGMVPSSIMYASWGRLMKKPSPHSYVLAVASVTVIVLGMYWARRYVLPRLKRRTAAAEEA